MYVCGGGVCVCGCVWVWVWVWVDALNSWVPEKKVSFKFEVYRVVD